MIIKLTNWVCSPFEQLWKDIKEFVSTNKMVVLAIMFFATICYGFEIFNFSLTFDEEWELALVGKVPYSNIDFFYIGNGRIIIAIIRKIFSINGAFVPFVSTFIGVFWLTITTLIFCVILNKIHNDKASKLAMIGFCGIFMSVPYIMAELIVFGVTCDITFFGIASIAIGIYFIIVNEDRKKSFYFVSCFFIFLSFNIYQAFVPLFITAFAIVLLNWIINKDNINLKQIICYSKPYIFIGAISLVAYYILTKIIANIYNLQYNYINNMIGWTSGADLYTIIRSICSSVYKAFDFSSNYGSKYSFITLIVFTIFVFVSFFTSKGKTKFYILFSSGFLILSIFSLNILLGSNMPFRTMINLALFLGATWFLIINRFKHIKWVRILLGIVVILIISKQVLMMNTFFYSSYQMSRNDQSTAVKISQDIIRENNGEMPTIPVIFVGKYAFTTPQNVRVDAIGGSLLNWYEPIRIYNLMYVCGYDFNRELLDSEEANEKAYQISRDMTQWPSKNSIVIQDDMIIVKLSEPLR